MRRINLFIKSLLIITAIFILIVSSTVIANAGLSKTNSKLMLKSDSPDFIFENGTITNYLGKDTDLVIPSIIDNLPVTSIGENVFQSDNNLKSITIPSSVTNINKNAFYSNYNLMNITVDKRNKEYTSDKGVLFNKNKTELIKCPEGKSGNYIIPNGVTIINENSFNLCRKITGITIPSSVCDINMTVFSDCSLLTNISVDKKNKIYSSDNGVLFTKNKTEILKYPEAKIGDYLIPKGVTTINYAFSRCEGLTSVTIPMSVKNIDIAEFNFCSGLKSIIVDKRNNVFSSEDGVLFNKDGTELIDYPGGKKGAYTVPNTVVRIKTMAFRTIDGLTSITFPMSVTTIGDYAFMLCKNLSSVTINNSSNIQIGHGAFNYCYGLTSVYFTGDAPKDFNPLVFPQGGCTDPLSQDFKVYYNEGAKGFTTPVWINLPCYPKNNQ